MINWPTFSYLSFGMETFLGLHHRFSSASRSYVVAAGSQSKIRISCHARINPPLCLVQSCMTEVVSPIHCLSTLPDQAHLHIRSLTDHTVYNFYKRINAKYKNINGIAESRAQKNSCFPHPCLIALCLNVATLAELVLPYHNVLQPPIQHPNITLHLKN